MKKKTRREFMVKGEISYNSTFFVNAETEDDAIAKIQRGEWDSVVHDGIKDYEATSAEENK